MEKETFIAGIYVQVTVTNTSRNTTFSKTTGDTEGKVIRALIGGHVLSIETAVLAVEKVKHAIFTNLWTSLTKIVQYSANQSPL